VHHGSRLSPLDEENQRLEPKPRVVLVARKDGMN
jgi:hypothetical protein